MAGAILAKLTDELAVLEQELKTFKTTVQYLNDARDGMNEAIVAVQSAENYHEKKLVKLENVYERTTDLIAIIDGLAENIKNVDFPSRLDIIEKRLGTVIQELNRTAMSTMNEVKAAATSITELNFEEKFGSANQKMEATEKGLLEKISTLTRDTGELISSLQVGLKTYQTQTVSKIKEVASMVEELEIPKRLDQINKTGQDTSRTLDKVKSGIKQVEDSIRGSVYHIETEIRNEIHRIESDLNQEIKKSRVENRVMLFIMVLSIIGLAYLLIKMHE
jgi:hypothetical protein